MGFSDFFADIYASITVQDVHAEGPEKNQEDLKYASGDFNSGKDQSPGASTAEQSGQTTTTGGSSMKSPVSGTDEESDEEAEINKEDEKKPSGDSGEKGHVAGSGGEGSGQVGPEKAGPDTDDEDKQLGSDDDEEGDEDEEDEDEPVDPKPALEAECMRSQQCSPLKHHYDECVERVTNQQEQHGKAHEDCVEEFFHLAHCATQCAAPKLFKQLR